MGQRATPQAARAGDTPMLGRPFVLGAAALFLVVIAALSAPAQAAYAATFSVNSTDDVPDFAPGNGVCDSTSGAGICTLRAAINEANTLGGSHTINLGTGTYALTVSGAGEEAGLTGDLDV